MANGSGYGVGLFDSKGPKDFAAAVKTIADELTGVSSAFSTLSKNATTEIGKISKAIDELIGKLKSVKVPSGGGGGGGGGGGLVTPGSPGWSNPPPDQGGMQRGSQWGPNQRQPNSKTGASPGMDGMPLGSAEQGAQMDTLADTIWGLDSARKANPDSMVKDNQPAGGPSGPGGGGGGGSMLSRGIQSMGAAAAGSAANYLGGPNGMIATSVQGATIGQLLSGQGFTSSAAKQYYQIPKNMLVQNVADYAQGNYYASQMMGVSMGTPQMTTLQTGTRQLMTMVPGMSYQGAMAVQGQMQSAQTLNAALGVGINLRPGGQMETPEQQYGQIFARMFPGGAPDKQTFDAVFAPGGTGQSNLASIGITPGSDAYFGFMQYARTRINMISSGKLKPNEAMPNVGTAKGAKQAGLDTPYYSQLQAESKKSQLESTMEPSIADAAKNLNDAAYQLMKYAQSGMGGMGHLSSLMGRIPGNPMSLLGHIPGLGGIMQNLPGVGGMFQGSFTAGLSSRIPLVGGLLHHFGFQEGGMVPSPDNVPAMLQPGEMVLPKDLVKQLRGGGASQLMGGSQSSSSSIGQLMAMTLTELQPNTVATLLFSPPGAGTLIAQMTGAAAHKGGDQAGGKAIGGKGVSMAEIKKIMSGGGGIGAAATLVSQLQSGQTAQQLGAGGTPGGSGTTSGGTAAPYAWSYKGAQLANVQDLSGLFSTSNSQSSDGSSPSAGGSGGTGAGAPTNLTGSGNAQQAYNFFLGKGLKDYQAAGIVGNMAQESGVVPNRGQQGGGGGYGLVQWTPPTALYAWAKAQNRDPTQLATQLDFLWSQISPGGSEAGTLPALQATTDAASAATSFEQTFERAGIPAMANRIKYAQNILASKGAGYARGSQRIDRTQLALLHRGEAVVPAADNYSASPYNRNGAGGGGLSAVYLNFKAGSVVLQVPASSSQQDMENIANQFIAAVSKPQILDAVRSS